MSALCNHLRIPYQENATQNSSYAAIGANGPASSYVTAHGIHAISNGNGTSWSVSTSLYG